ncbi:Rho-GAP domain-containing protein [Mycena kentingensis (nom. inval.)]|nr:Rho-GAP domain-containing protein [Mycena kentingensis (nom. inval.)]
MRAPRARLSPNIHLVYLTVLMATHILSAPPHPAAPRLRSASASATPDGHTQTDKKTKRHTYHELGVQQPGQHAHPNPWNRVASLPQFRQPARAAPPVPAQPRPRRLENLDPRPLLRTLNALLDPATQRIPDYLDLDHLVALYERDAMEREHRDAMKVRARLDRARNRTSNTNLNVFGASLRETTMYASAVTILGGFEHDLPIVVFRCVKELCRHGFPSTDQKPDRDRLLALISTFDEEPQFGSKAIFNAPYELLEIYGLLTTYLFALPEPILSAEMFEAIWTWCCVPSLREGSIRRHEATDVGIQIVLILLRLLPIPNFSLVVYLMGFFQRLPHLASEDIARAVFAGQISKTSAASDGRAERVPALVNWLVDRWDVVLQSLFESPQPLSGCRPLRFPTKKVTMDLDFNARREDAAEDDDDASSVSSSCALGERLQDLTRELAQDAQREAKLRNRRAVLHRAPETAPSSDEENRDSGYESPEEIPEAASPSPPPQEDPDQEALSHSQALRRISLLERELERSDHAVEEAISKTFQAQNQVKELEAKLRMYEGHPPRVELSLENCDKRAVDDWHAVLHSDTDALKRYAAADEDAWVPVGAFGRFPTGEEVSELEKRRRGLYNLSLALKLSRPMYCFSFLGVLVVAVAGGTIPKNSTRGVCPTTPSAEFCKGTQFVSNQFLCGDQRLGPAVLPSGGHWGALLAGYARFGAGATTSITPGVDAAVSGCPAPATFLKRWFNESEWQYHRPAADGFQLSTAHKPIGGEQVLPRGALVDRFYALYDQEDTLWPAGTPFRMRALPPSSLNNPVVDLSGTDDATKKNAPEYRVYEVVYPFVVRAGPAAAFYGQPGQGTVYQTRTSVDMLVEGGFLRRVKVTRIRDIDE